MCSLLLNPYWLCGSVVKNDCTTRHALSVTRGTEGTEKCYLFLRSGDADQRKASSCYEPYCFRDLREPVAAQKSVSDERLPWQNRHLPILPRRNLSLCSPCLCGETLLYHPPRQGRTRGAEFIEKDGSPLIGRCRSEKSILKS